jgi:hypothetical protein
MEAATAAQLRLRVERESNTFGEPKSNYGNTSIQKCAGMYGN